MITKINRIIKITSITIRIIKIINIIKITKMITIIRIIKITLITIKITSFHLLTCSPGTVCFLADLLHPDQAAFPFSEVFF